MSDTLTGEEIRKFFFTFPAEVGYDLSGKWTRSKVPIKFNAAIGWVEYFINEDGRVLAVGKGGVEFVRDQDSR